MAEDIYEIVDKEQNLENVNTPLLIENYYKKAKDSHPNRNISLNDLPFVLPHTRSNYAGSLNEHIANQNITFIGGWFNHTGSAEHTIDSEIELKNNTDRRVEFTVPEGQMFTCIEGRSQHVVVKEFKGFLGPKEQKKFLLAGFCADDKRSWPREDKNFAFAQLHLKDFTPNQSEIWRKTACK